ncbi:hypothetical protein ACU4GD_41950 [Cupriavidus basilensis]
MVLLVHSDAIVARHPRAAEYQCQPAPVQGDSVQVQQVVLNSVA